MIMYAKEIVENPNPAKFLMHDKMKLDYNNLIRLIRDGGKHET